MTNREDNVEERGDSHSEFANGDMTSNLVRAELAEAQLASVAELADVGVLIFDTGGGVKLVNDRLGQLLGIERVALMGARTWSELSAAIANRLREPEVFLDRWRDRMQRADGASWDELELARPQGGTIERFGRPLFGSTGEPLGRLEIYRDISTKRIMGRKLLQINKLAGLGQLIGGTVHELNNPLTGIMGYAQLLLRRELPPQAAGEARQIYQEADRAARIIRNLLLFVREDRGERAAVNLNYIAEYTVALRSHQLGLENIRMDLILDPSLPAIIADAGQLQQVALNLVINAEQAIGQSNSGGTITLRTELRAHGKVVLEISDTGPGIEADILPSIFDPFFTTKPPGMGTGLGLSVAFGIVQDHGGHLSVRSDRGRGARFTIELPATAATTQHTVATAPPPSARPASRAPALRHERLLVIEDEPTVARFIADALGEDGHVVDMSLNSREGLAKALEFRYDLLICDLKMPYPDGRAIYEELSRRHSPLERRTIFITGDTLATRTMDFLEFAGLPYLAKPFRVEDLKSAVAGVLAQTGAHSEAEASPNERRRQVGTAR